ncbi:hypothetical protein [Acidianus ambivalens]|uniref:Uncharacterized protein n=1 Tax=Acidianus ambivalens TaxID=2283 RepID=A0A650CW53_ACIAM|nr:hypothetical protein [Acidianus ambivalens]MQL55751.1 hypothetical protein [Acidianus ambivalens]QGR21677.1 hypothetical protein D1866_06475 [Acidianus ambivalens]
MLNLSDFVKEISGLEIYNKTCVFCGDSYVSLLRKLESIKDIIEKVEICSYEDYVYLKNNIKVNITKISEYFQSMKDTLKYLIKLSKIDVRERITIDSYIPIKRLKNLIFYFGNYELYMGENSLIIKRGKIIVEVPYKLKKLGKMLLEDNNIPGGYYIVKTDKFDINKLKEIKYDCAYVKITRKVIKVDYFVGKDYLELREIVIPNTQ